MTAPQPQSAQPPQPGQPYWPQQPPPPMHSVQWPMAPAAPPPPMVDGFMLVQPRLKPIPSGPAIGSMIAGIGAVLAGLPGLVAAGVSPWAGLTFFLLTVLLGGVGGVGLSTAARRQIKRANGGISGRGFAITGLILGLVALGIALIIGIIAIAVG